MSDLGLSDEVSLIAHDIGEKLPDSARLLWRLADAIDKIEQWTKAYPEDIFLPMTTEDWRDHHAMLKGHGRSGSAAAADCMRHVALGMKKILDEVMHADAPKKQM
jgi:hypothetical protein